jgi:hypothetical protein
MVEVLSGALPALGLSFSGKRIGCPLISDSHPEVDTRIAQCIEHLADQAFARVAGGMERHAARVARDGHDRRQVADDTIYFDPIISAHPNHRPARRNGR